jgi:hypothetical protein
LLANTEVSSKSHLFILCVHNNSNDHRYTGNLFYYTNTIRYVHFFVSVLFTSILSYILVKICTFKYERRTKNTIQYNSRTRSIAVGDFNQDRRLDLAVANYGSDSIGILVGIGDGTFASQTTYSTDDFSYPYAVTVYDFDNDTRLDIAVANFGTNNVGILLGYGNGSFKTQETFSAESSRPIAIVHGDFNNDSRMDIAIANYGTSDIGILLGFGDGRFTPQISYSTGYDSDPRSLAVGDFNKDGRLDIAVANFGTNNIGVFLGYGNGGFGNLNTYPTSLESRPYSLAVGDFNMDNQLDIIVANSGMDNVGVLLGYGNGSFASQMSFSTGNGSNPHSVIVADFNNDNLQDIAVANTGTDSVGVLLGYGNGTFTSQITYTTGVQTGVQFVAIGDFNNDSRMDIVLANNNTNNVGVLLGVRTADFRNQMTYVTDSQPNSLAVGDFNNDKQLDIVVCNFGGNNAGVFLGYENGTFANQMTYSSGNGSNPYFVAVGDFNNDNRLDFVVANSGTNTIGVFLGYGNGSFANQLTYSTGDGSLPYSVAVGDFNNDNRLDVVVANFNTNNIGIFLGYGNGSFANQITYATDSGPISVVVGNFNNDSRLDIVALNYYAMDVGVFLGQDNGTFANQVTYSTGEISYPQFVTVGDVDNDSRLDIITANTPRSTFGFLSGYGDGTFANHRDKWTGAGSEPVSVIAADFDSDGRMDVAVANFGIATVGVLQGIGGGFFHDAVMYETDGGPSQVVIGDFNKDNRLDIAVVNFNGNSLGIFLGYDAGKFNTLTEFSTSYGSLPTSLTIGDFNRDNQMDMAVSNYGSNNLGVFFGNGSGSFVIDGTYFTGFESEPSMVISADLNDDNILDLATTNVGLDSIGVFLGYKNGSFADQTLYSTNPNSKPQFLATGDFNNDNRADLVVANFGADNIGVLLGYNLETLVGQLIYPSTGEIHLTSMAIGDFNNDNQLDIVGPDLDTSSVFVFFGEGNGTFLSHITYSTGTGSSPYSVAVGDFNNDNHLDIVVANYGTNNVGLFFGYGNGTFTNQITYSTDSGPYAVNVGDFNSDHQLDIVVTNYNANNINILFGYGNGSFENPITYPTDAGPASVAVDDFNHDSRLDIVVVNNDGNSMNIFLGYGNGTFANPITYLTGNTSNPYFVAVGDFNNDNQTDIIVAYSGSDYVAVFLGYGNGTFANPTTNYVGSQSNPTTIAVGDFNNDNRLDFVVTNRYNNFVGLWLGYGNGAFSGQYRIDEGSFFSPKFVVTGDFNNDGKLDMAVYDQYRLYSFLGSYVKAFLNVQTFSTGSGSSPHSVSVGDFNNDNLMDIVVANSGSDTIGIFLGLGYANFDNQTTYSTGDNSMPYSVAVGDFNNDSCADIGIANYGAGNIGIFLGYGNGSFAPQATYLTDPTFYPYSLALNDVNNDTRLDIVIANFGSNSVVIVFGVGDGTFVDETKILMGYGAQPVFVALAYVTNKNWLDISVTNYGTGNIEIISETC